MKDYFYVNSRLLKEYSRQLGLPLSTNEVSKKSSKTNISVNPKHERNKETVNTEVPDYILADTLTSALVQTGNVRKTRPFVMESHYSTELEQPFVLERMVATKLVFRDDQIASMSGLRELAVWVSDPDPSQLVDEEWTWHGTFLLLPEANFDDGIYHTVMSGCSALQMLYNGLVGDELAKRDFEEPLGRANNHHPVNKLKKLGAIEIGLRKIESLYRMRYLTNEQCYTFEGKEFRVNDLLGYPIYLAEDL